MSTRFLLAGALAFAASLDLSAAGSAASSPPPTVPQAAVQITAADRGEAIDASRELFRKGDLAGGEELLFAVNRMPAGSPQANLESASALLHMSCLFLQDGDAARATELAGRALARLARARVAFNHDARMASGIEGEIGFLQERIIGNRAAAKAAYQAAMTLSPRTSVEAANALQRLDDEDTLANRRPAKTQN